MCILISNGPSIDPCGTPILTNIFARFNAISNVDFLYCLLIKSTTRQGQPMANTRYSV